MATITAYKLSVDVDDNTQYATVYKEGGRIAGTIMRRRVLDKTSKDFTIYNRDGEQVYASNNVAWCLKKLSHHIEDVAARALK